MTNELLKQLDELAGSDDFEFDSEEIMERLEEEGAGFETVGELLAIIERHPLDDFGMPGAVTRFIEGYYPDFLPLLIDSVRRCPAMHTVWMINRYLNAKQSREELLGALKAAADDHTADKLIRDTAREFLEYQQAR